MKMVDGLYAFPLSGDKYIAYTNGSNDEAHYAGYTITGGTGGRVFLQPISSTYLIRNIIPATFDANGKQTTVGDVLFTIDGTNGAIVPAGVTTIIVNDGVSNVWQIGVGGEGNKGLHRPQDRRDRCVRRTTGVRDRDRQPAGSVGSRRRVPDHGTARLPDGRR